MLDQNRQHFKLYQSKIFNQDEVLYTPCGQKKFQWQVTSQGDLIRNS